MKKYFGILMTSLVLTGCFVCEKTPYECPVADGAAPVARRGTTAAVPSATRGMVKAPRNPEYEYNAVNLTRRGIENMESTAKFLMQYPDAEVIIYGYNDLTGDEYHNQALSTERANAAAQVLVEQYGIRNPIKVLGRGHADPLSLSNSESGRANNRRVEVYINK